MRILRAVLLTLLLVGAILLFGRFFLSQLSGRGGGADSGPTAIVDAPPPGYAIVERGELAPAAAAAELEAQLQNQGAERVGVHFKRRGSAVYWLADTAADRLEERSSGAGGTRLATLWQGGLRQRLAWARVHGDPAAPGLPPPETKNLYH